MTGSSAMNPIKLMHAVWLLTVPVLGEAATIHECRAYNGSTFYSSSRCSQHNALGVLNHTVPDGLPFDQQVAVVRAAKAKEQVRVLEYEARRSAPSSGTERNKEWRCQQLDQAIAATDSALRQPHSAQRGDQLTAERKRLMDRRFDLRC